MTKLKAIIQLLISAVLAVSAVASLVNMAFIITRPETISVVNAMIGLGTLAICLAALSRILLRRGLAQLRDPDPAGAAQSGPASGTEDSSRHEA
ncbi:MAG: hypothetical protein PsegKO_35740 [Pseudohongiellaceae bacterium]|jgi:hypothetical protein